MDHRLRWAVSHRWYSCVQLADQPVGDLNVVAQLLMLPFIALLIAAPGSFLVFKLWEKG